MFSTSLAYKMPTMLKRQGMMMMDICIGRRFVIELVDQPHIYEAGSWQDEANWTLLFLAAYV
jgi:hypothetical protein